MRPATLPEEEEEEGGKDEETTHASNDATDNSTGVLNKA